MLVLLPASKGKHPVRRGKALDPAALSFPSLAPTREAVLDGLIEVSGAPDATTRLGERDGLAELVADNVLLRDAPTAAAGSVYAGVVYDGLGLHDLDTASLRRARAWIVVISALWGAVRLGDRIPPYRLDMCGRLPGLAHLPMVWRQPLEEVLPAAVGKGLLVDCRSAEYQDAWRPAGELTDRTVLVKVIRSLGDGRGAASYGAKRTRGLVARHIARHAINPRRPDQLATALAEHLDVELHPPTNRRNATWELHVVEPPQPEAGERRQPVGRAMR